MAVSSCFHYCSSVIELDVRDGDASGSSFIVQNCLGYPGFFVFPYEVEYYSCKFFKSLMSTGVFKNDLIILWISSMSVVMFPFSFLILLICMFSFCLFVNLDLNACQCCQCSWRTSSLFHWCFVLFSFYFIDFCSQYDYFLASSPPGWVCFFLF